MKKVLGVIAFIGFYSCVNCFAAILDRNYYVAESVIKDHFDVFNDGKNTYIESIKGLIVRGAIADGARLIVAGVPNEIRGVFRGTEITIVKGLPSGYSSQDYKSPQFDNSTGSTGGIKSTEDRIASLTKQIDELNRLSSTGDSKSTLNAEESKNVELNPKQSEPLVEQIVPIVETWEVKNGDSLKEILDGWRTRAGWDLVWDYDGGFAVRANAKFVGSFQTAVKSLIDALPKSVNISVEMSENKLVYVSKGKN